MKQTIRLFVLLCAISTGILGLPTDSDAADFCGAVAGGATGVHSPAVDLSLAHALVRFFSPENKYSIVDQALVSAMQATGTLDNALAGNLLSTYASGLKTVSAVNADPRPLPAAYVEMSNTTAVIHPGTGSITIPAGAKSVAIDLRNLPDASGLFDALQRAVGAAIATSVSMPNYHVRQHTGMTDEFLTSESPYTNSVITLSQPSISATGAKTLPLAFLTDDIMAPAASSIAGAMRLDRKAVIIGSDIHSSIAEARFVGVGNQGISVRTKDLYFRGDRWPDVIPAVVETDNPEQYLAAIPLLYPPLPLMAPAATRPAIEVVSPFNDVQPVNATLREALAALVVTHGALRVFFPYFATVGDYIDDRLLETVNSAETAATLDRTVFSNLLRRFGEAIKDGHSGIHNYGPPTTAGYFPAFIENVDNTPAIRSSLVSGVNPGDTIVTVDGQSAADALSTEAALTSAATSGFMFYKAGFAAFTALEKTTDFGLKALDGSTRTVTIVPYSSDVENQVSYAPTLRHAGYLADLGAPDLYYINLDEQVLQSEAQFLAALAPARNAAGLVLDMRGYPAVNNYDIAARVICASFSGPIFRIPVYTGPDQYQISESQYRFLFRQNPSYCGPVVLLVGPRTVSAAENLGIMLVDAHRITVVGRQSAGTDGNITGILLPGGFGFIFTGMEVLHNDRSTFHGIGIVPDVLAAPQAADLPASIDRELNTAISVLKQQMRQ